MLDSSIVVTVITGITSVVIAAFAVWQANQMRRESLDNYNKTRDLLAEVDKRAAVIQEFVSQNQTQLLDTVKELAIPAQPDMEQQLLQAVTASPELMKMAIEGAKEPQPKQQPRRQQRRKQV